MSDQMDEHEQGEKVRKWLQENGTSILFGLALGLGGIWGVGKFQDVRGARFAEAGDQYAKLTEAVEKKDEAAIKALSEAMRKSYAKSPYATLAALDEGTRLIGEGKLEDAVAALKWAHQNAEMKELRDLAAVRLARLQLALAKPDDAIATLAAVKGKGYQALAAEVRGDAHLAKKNTKDALAAYDESLTHFDEASPRRAIVEMKRDDIATIEGT